jgi:SOS-response transcriptional repressor LexA
MIGLTTEHGRLLAFIREHVSRFGYAPTISVALEHLEDYDFIRREPRRSRALEVACSRIPLTACAFVPVQDSGSAVA